MLLLPIAKFFTITKQKGLVFDYNTKGHIPELDGVRGLAIILVLINHFLKFNPYLTIANFGWVGVDLFFVLSGFLITGILINNKTKKNYFKNFYMRRVLRIFPLYYLVLLILFFVLPYLIKLPSGYEYFLSRKTFYFLYLQNNLFILDGWPKNDLLSHLWSLAIEEQFYLFWPFVVFTFKEKYVVFISLLIVLLCITIRVLYPNVLLSYFSSFTRFDGLCIGSLAAIMIRQAPKLTARYLPYIFLSSAILIIYWLLKTDFQTDINNYYFMRWGYSVLDIFWACLILFSLCVNRYVQLVGVFFRLKPLRFFGIISYGIYMFHMLLFGLVTPEIISLFNKSGLAIDSYFNMPIAISITVLTVLLSYISYKYFEAPILKLKNKFA